jgi:2-keto-4-pentenoate hydratase/2-oxohepta-3-ene-1,7-dioic acid hydratase in catechol pathway
MILQLGSQNYSPQRIFCIGKNYAEHVKELGGRAPGQPVVFMKPVSCLAPPGETIHMPTHGSNLHHEVEVVVLIGKPGKHISETAAATHIAGLTLGLDLTLRDVQSAMKKKGWPWEISKAFDQSAPCGNPVSYDENIALDNISFDCRVNGDLRQTGNSGEMMFPIPHLIHYLSGIWELREGDLIFTGTPSGVGPLHPGDRVTLHSDLLGTFEWSLA